MVLHEQFPLFRLATLLARQLSAPIASRIKEYAKGHPRFGRAVCMRSGRAAAAAELRFKLWTLRLRTTARPALSDARALEAGADLLGEMILFALGAAIVTFEYNRQATNQETKLDEERSAWLAVQLQAEELRRELHAQQRDLDRLAAELRALSAARPPPPPPPRGPAPEAPATPAQAPPDNLARLCPCPEPEPSTDPPL